MKEKDKHINQKPDSDYPKPSVSADHAWANMKEMLNQEMPVPEAPSAGKYAWIKSLKFIASAFIFLSAGLLLWIFRSDKNDVSTFTIKEEKTISFPKTPDKTVKTHSEKDIHAGGNLKRGSFGRDLASNLKNTSPEVGNANYTDDKGQTGSGRSTYSHADISNLEKIRTKKTHVDNEFARRAAYPHPKAQSVIKGNLTGRVKNSRNFTGKDDSDQQNNFAANPGIEFSPEEKKLVKTLNDSFYQPVSGNKSLPLLVIHSSLVVNRLNQQFSSIAVKELPKSVMPLNEKKEKLKSLLKSFNIGLQWDVSLPVKGYGQFFTGANKYRQPYTLFIPGIYIEKKLNNGNGVLLRFNPYNQYFGGNRPIVSSTISLPDTTGITLTETRKTSLIKAIGMSSGLQYNQHIADRWSIGLGANIYWQRNALLSSSVTSSDSGFVRVDSVLSINSNSADWKYIKSYFLSTHLEVFYSWSRFQFGGGMNVPVTGMTRIADKKARPVSGYLLFRWMIK